MFETIKKNEFFYYTFSVKFMYENKYDISDDNFNFYKS